MFPLENSLDGLSKRFVLFGKYSPQIEPEALALNDADHRQGGAAQASGELLEGHVVGHKIERDTGQGGLRQSAAADLRGTFTDGDLQGQVRKGLGEFVGAAFQGGRIGLQRLIEWQRFAFGTEIRFGGVLQRGEDQLVAT